MSGGSRHPVRWTVLPILTIAVVGVLALFTYSLITEASGRNLVSQIASGDNPSAPPFTLPVVWVGEGQTAAPHVVVGQPLPLASLRGYPIVINFWASWCVPCQKEAPELADAAVAHPDVVFLGVNVQDLEDDAQGFLSRYRVPYTSLRDGDSTVFRAYGLTGVPETYYLDRNGRIRSHTAGPVTTESLEAAIAGIARP